MTAQNIALKCRADFRRFDDMRELVEEEWPELVHKLPPKILVRFDLSLDADKDRADNCSLFPKLLLTQCRLI